MKPSKYPGICKVDKNDVFSYLCEVTAAISPEPTRIRSIRAIANAFGTTKYNVERCLHELKSDGLVEVGHYGGMDEDGIVYCYHGFCLTAKGVDTDVFKEIDKRTIQEMNMFLKRWYEQEEAHI